MKPLLEGDATPTERMLLEAGLAEESPAPARLFVVAPPRRLRYAAIVAAFAVAAGVALFAYHRHREPVADAVIVAAPETSLILVNSAQPPPLPAVEPSIAPAVVKTAAPPVKRSAPATVNTPFDKSAAAHALGAVDVQACAAASGPNGSGHVTVTFEPDGTVSSSVVDQGPFPGTAVGGCLAGKFKSVTVPSYVGNSVRVGKSFVIN